jgi:hypothetical protein
MRFERFHNFFELNSKGFNLGWRWWRIKHGLSKEPDLF